MLPASVQSKLCPVARSIVLVALLPLLLASATAGEIVSADTNTARAGAAQIEKPASVIVGQVVSAGASCDGIAVPSGTTILSPSVVRTGEKPAILHLVDGSLLALLAESTAHFEISDDGRLEVVVEAGKLVYADAGGTIAELAQPARAVWALAPAEAKLPDDQVSGSASTAKIGERLCELVEWTPAQYQLCKSTDPRDSSCVWGALIVPASEASVLVGTRAVYAGADRNQLGLDENCGQKVDDLPLPGEMGIGAAALAAYLLEELDEEERPASPVIP